MHYQTRFVHQSKLHFVLKNYVVNLLVDIGFVNKLYALDDKRFEKYSRSGDNNYARSIEV